MELGGAVNLIVQTGGAKQWQLDIRSDALQRYALENHDLTLVDEQPLASMGDGETLGDFLSWGVEQYPADHYMVVLWDHGSSVVDGLVFDELFGNDSLTLNELADGLAAPGVTFELIGFDTCLMASMENAAMVAPYGRYMVASEEIEPGGGWDYGHWTQYLAAHPESDGLALGKVICDSYYDKCAASGNEAMATLSVIDLAAIPALTAAFDDMAGEMAHITTDITTLQAFAKGASRAENYGGNTADEGYTNMVDLGDLVLNTEDVLVETGDAMLEALFAAVPYQVKGSNRLDANGLSVFFPISLYDNDLDRYADVATSAQYLRYLEVMYNWTAPDWVEQQAEAVVGSVSEEDYDIALSTYISDDGYYYLLIDNALEAVQDLQFSLFYLDYDSNECLLLGYDDDIGSDWESGVFSDNFRGVWATLNGFYCAPRLIGYGDDYNLYSIPILLNGRQTNLRARYVWEAEGGHYELLGVWDGIDSDSGMAARDIYALEDGDEVTLLFDAYQLDSGETYTYEMGGFVVDGTVTMEESPLTDGEYMYQYIVTDLFGNEYYSDPIIMKCDDGDIYLYEMQ